MGHKNKVNSQVAKEKIVLTALNEKQKEVLKTIHENTVTIIHGSPGTGKTYLPVVYALKEFIEKRKYNRLIFTRPCVEAYGENLGFLPGDYNEKISPYMMPIFDTIGEFLEKAYVKKLIDEDSIVTLPLAFQRGITFKKAFVIADEFQNTIPEQVRLLLSRIGSGTKVVITGDLNQVDRDRKEANGLKDAINRLEGVEGVGIVHLDDTCIVRDPIVRRIEERYS